MKRYFLVVAILVGLGWLVYTFWPETPLPADIEAALTAPVKLERGSPFPLKERDYWPTAGWRTIEPEAVGIDPVALKKLEDYAFLRTGDDDNKQGQRTNALLITKDGYLVFERYARGYHADSVMLTWSVSKSITNLVLGAAVKERRLQLDSPASIYYPPLDTDDKRDIRITDLLRMSSGLSWREGYELTPLFSSVISMLYTHGRQDMGAFATTHEMANPIGSNWSYASGTTNLLMKILQKRMAAETYANYPWKTIFDPIGAKRVTWERDASDTFVGSSYLYAAPRDLAKMGFLALNDGLWDGERLLAHGWMTYSLTPAPSSYRMSKYFGLSVGAHWYINRGDPERGIEPRWPNLPQDMFYASGHWGKAMFIIPSLDMIIVRLGDDREYGCSPDGGFNPFCVEDYTKAYNATYFLQLVMDTVKGGDES